MLRRTFTVSLLALMAASPAFASSSSSGADTVSNGTPADSSMRRRVALCEASSSFMPCPARSARSPA